MTASKITTSRMLSEQAAVCEKMPETYLSLLISSAPTRELLYILYTDAVTCGIVIKLEDQPVEVKKQFWQDSVKDAGGRLVLSDLKKLAKGYYVLDHFIKTK
jgi:hypothetical protein